MLGGLLIFDQEIINPEDEGDLGFGVSEEARGGLGHEVSVRGEQGDEVALSQEASFGHAVEGFTDFP
jgi:hypothetical protein